jgi:hypothetical protein
VDCSSAGLIYSNNPIVSLPYIEIATTNAIWTPAIGTPICHGGIAVNNCEYPVIDNCTTSTSPPDNIMTGENVFWSHPYGGETYVSWDVKALCISANGHKPWSCSYGYATLLSVNIPVAQQVCTYNP